MVKGSIKQGLLQSGLLNSCCWFYCWRWDANVLLNLAHCAGSISSLFFFLTSLALPLPFCLSFFMSHFQTTLNSSAHRDIWLGNPVSAMKKNQWAAVSKKDQSLSPGCLIGLTWQGLGRCVQVKDTDADFQLGLIYSAVAFTNSRLRVKWSRGTDTRVGSSSRLTFSACHSTHLWCVQGRVS